MSYAFLLIYISVQSLKLKRMYPVFKFLNLCIKLIFSFEKKGCAELPKKPSAKQMLLGYAHLNETVVWNVVCVPVRGWVYLHLSNGSWISFFIY